MKSTSLLSLLVLAVGCAPVASTSSEDPLVDQALSHLEARPDLSFVEGQESFELRDLMVDEEGSTHVRLDRRYQGLRVIGGDVVVHSELDGRLREISATLAAPIRVDIHPAVPVEDALAIAADEQAGKLTAEPTAEKVIYARGEFPVLAWAVRVDGIFEDGHPSELVVIVDALTGEVLEQWDGIQEAAAAGTGRALYLGTVSLTTNSVASGYELRDPGRGNSYTINMNNRTNGGSIFTDADNTWGNGTTSDSASAAVDAQYGAAVSWDYYLNTHGRNGIANNGAGSYSRVHYSRRYNNAFWSDSCFCMTYGDGDGNTLSPLVSLDVAGHEMSHGVTSRTANLTYSGESGGLNEATSDIFGTMIEYYANNASDAGDYKIGEKIYRNGTSALRYMYYPEQDGVSRGCYVSTLGSLDVHYSSGVANHFFYLLAEGSSTGLSHVCNTGTVVTGIGRAAAERIWYRALTVYMTSGSKYTNARTATLNAATDLYGSGSAEYTAVANAWTAVQVN